jgi:hypothetical protein
MEAPTETEIGVALPGGVLMPKISAGRFTADLKAEAVSDSERNPIFDALVSPDEDVTDLVAYSIYKQNKRAWLDAFIKATGRGPSEAETRAYIIGESTERRLNTYRQLAATTLAGQGPRGPATGGAKGRAGSMAGAAWALVVVIIAGGVLALAMHAGYLTPPK